jgi:uncharacterized protein (TIGR00299 family) protein
MRIGHLDCFSGAAGDMWVGACIDAGVALPDLAAAVEPMGLGVQLVARRVLRCGLAGTRFEVREPPAPAGARQPPHARGHDHGHGHPHEHAHEHGHPHDHERAPRAEADRRPPGGHAHRGLAEIRALLARAKVPAATAARARAVFELLADVESRAHDVPREAVHFHEVGAVDTIVDVVCACHAVGLLGLERLHASAVVVGTGEVDAAHGRLPVPAPGTLAALLGIPIRTGGVAGEMVTPTGAALLKTLVASFEPEHAWVPAAIGYGAGARDLPQRPNLLRLTVGDLRHDVPETTMFEVACNLDTATGEQLGYLLDGLLARGAADAFAVPVHMKKGRPGHQLVALVDGARREAAVAFLLEESSSLGVRMHRVDRAVLERWGEVADTPFGPVRFKCARLPSGALLRRPEDDEVARLVRETGLPRRELLARLARA